MKSSPYCLLPLVTFLILTACGESEKKEEKLKIEVEKVNPEQQKFQEKGEEDISLQEAANYFASVAAHAMTNYVEPTSYKTLLNGALEGMLSNLDPHSSFLTEEEFVELKEQTNGQYAGLGIEVAMEEGALRVITPIDNSPAARAGLQIGDLIVRIEKSPVYGMSLSRAIELLKGEPSTSVEVTVRREGKEDFPIRMTRDIIQSTAVKSEMFDNVLYLRISTFNSTTTSGVQDAIKKAKKEYGDQFQGLLLDLRNNAGGLFDEAATLADLFLREGTIVSIRTRQGTEEHRVKAKDDYIDDLTNNLSMAVLINAGTASSSEIFAGALQDYNRAIILGTESFGKGSVQSVVPLKNGAAIKLTTALYHTPKGTSIQKNGIKPDIQIQQAKNVEQLDEGNRLREANFEKAISSSQTKAEESKNIAEKKYPKEIEDYQLRRAIDVLQGIILSKRNDKKKDI